MLTVCIPMTYKEYLIQQALGITPASVRLLLDGYTVQNLGRVLEATYNGDLVAGEIVVAHVHGANYEDTCEKLLDIIKNGIQ
ncbi:hypothetical protein LCGC14_1581690 [marine sediment metagenome]|uniref:Uncharacterized protein n=1 Tax=marine sediment metagenome TaxID=412755 RepID=A0A0F9IGN3_9ZZZZ